MQKVSAIARLTGAAALASIVIPLAACSGGSPAALPQSALPAANSAPAIPSTQAAAQSEDVQATGTAKPKLLFVSDNEKNKIFVFNEAATTQNPTPTRTITSGIKAPNGIATDSAGNLYVTNTFPSTVTVYGPGASKPKLTISNGLANPQDVKVDEFGNVYVANNPGGGAAGFISEYAKGATSPEYTWTAPALNMTISGLTLLDPKLSGSVAIYATEWVENPDTSATGGILSCFPGTSTCVQLGGYTFGQTGGIAMEQSPGYSKPFEFLVVDQYVPGFDVFQPQAQSAPIDQIVTGGTPEYLTFNGGRTDVFVADRLYGQVDEYTWPGLKLVNHFNPQSGGAIYGVATSPSGSLF